MRGHGDAAAPPPRERAAAAHSSSAFSVVHADLPLLQVAVRGLDYHGLRGRRVHIVFRRVRLLRRSQVRRRVHTGCDADRTIQGCQSVGDGSLGRRVRRGLLPGQRALRHRRQHRDGSDQRQRHPAVGWLRSRVRAHVRERRPRRLPNPPIFARSGTARSPSRRRAGSPPAVAVATTKRTT